MKNIVIYFIAQSVAIISVVISGVLAYCDKSGWGWFLIMAVANTVGGYTSRSEVTK